MLEGSINPLSLNIKPSFLNSSKNYSPLNAIISETLTFGWEAVS